MTDTTTPTQTATTDAHEELYGALEGEPIVKLRRIAPTGTSKMAKKDLVRRIVEEREEEARALVGMTEPEAKPAKLPIKDKQRLGDLLVKAAADLLDDLPEDVDRELAADWLGSIMVYTPRTFVEVDGERTRWWDSRLPFNAPKSWRDR